LISSPSRVSNRPSAPWWYFTSPVPECGIAAIALTWSSAFAPSNSARIDSTERPRFCASTLSRPRWAIPITTSSAPDRRARVKISSIMGTTASKPSIENDFCPR
jgi:hypothetical protein